MRERLELIKAPELVFGLVAPVGVDLDLVTEVLSKLLKEMTYRPTLVRLTSLMMEVALPLPVAETPYVSSVRNRIAYANAVRVKLGDDALAAMAISAIRTFREEERRIHKHIDVPGEMMNPEETPLPGYAYIVRQLKRPEEVALLRAVYGRQFILRGFSLLLRWSDMLCSVTER